jgi:hypothetical protein
VVIFLNKKMIVLLILLTMLYTATSAFGAITVGVKKGDWIEYDVSSTGSLDASHNITHARMEVLDVQGMIVQVNILSTYSNGTQVSTDSTLNLETGQLIDNFIIPAGLTTGNEFSSTMGNMGKMMIGNTMQRTYCGSTRSVVTATSDGNTYIWDQATGVSVEGTTEAPTYTMHSLATATNMWLSQAAVPDMTLVYVAVIVIVVIVVVAAGAILTIRSRKK